MNVWVLCVACKTWNDVLGVYSSLGNAIDAKISVLKDQGGASSLSGGTFIIEKKLDEGIKKK